jgi:hypothetical protein
MHLKNTTSNESWGLCPQKYIQVVPSAREKSSLTKVRAVGPVVMINGISKRQKSQTHNCGAPTT